MTGGIVDPTKPLSPLRHIFPDPIKIELGMWLCGALMSNSVMTRSVITLDERREMVIAICFALLRERLVAKMTTRQRILLLFYRAYAHINKERAKKSEGNAIAVSGFFKLLSLPEEEVGNDLRVRILTRVAGMFKDGLVDRSVECLSAAPRDRALLLDTTQSDDEVGNYYAVQATVLRRELGAASEGGGVVAQEAWSFAVDHSKGTVSPTLVRSAQRCVADMQDPLAPERIAFMNARTTLRRGGIGRSGRVHLLTEVARCYAQGAGVDRNFVEAIRFYTKACQLGCCDTLGCCLAHAQLKELVEEAVLSVKERAFGLFSLARLATAEKVDPNEFLVALEDIVRADAAHVCSVETRDVFFLRGEWYTQCGDKSAAHDQYMLAVDLNYGHGALYALGKLHEGDELGEGHMRRAADEGSHDAYFYFASKSHALAKSLPPDDPKRSQRFQEAASYYGKAAALGVPVARFLHGWDCAKYGAVPESYESAINWLRSLLEDMGKLARHEKITSSRIEEVIHILEERARGEV